MTKLKESLSFVKYDWIVLITLIVLSIVSKVFIGIKGYGFISVYLTQAIIEALFPLLFIGKKQHWLSRVVLILYAFSFVGAYFKIQHYPYSDIILIGSVGELILILVFLIDILRNRSSYSGNAKFYILAALGVYIISNPISSALLLPLGAFGYVGIVKYYFYYHLFIENPNKIEKYKYVFFYMFGVLLFSIINIITLLLFRYV